MEDGESDGLIARFQTAHRAMNESFETIRQMHEAGMFGGLSADTTFAIGYALGCISKAKALIGRDIDQMS